MSAAEEQHGDVGLAPFTTWDDGMSASAPIHESSPPPRQNKHKKLNPSFSSDALHSYMLTDHHPHDPEPTTLTRSRSSPRVGRRASAQNGASDSVADEAVLVPPPVEKLARIHQWIIAFAIVNFDLDIGPVVDILYPPISLTPKEKQNM
jgi:hypothetical protein